MFCTKCSPCVLHGNFVSLYIDVASIKHYLNAIKAKQSALNARKPLVGGRTPTSALGPSGSNFGPSGLAPIGIHHLFPSNLTTADESLERLFIV